MDNERQIRFLYPPFILLGSLALGLYFSNSSKLDCLINHLNNNDLKDLILVVIGGGVLILVTGYIIGTITITLLRLRFICKHGAYEIDHKQDIKCITDIILKSEADKPKEKEKFYAFVTYDHVFLPDNIHKWIQRRWNSFYTSANSATSLVLSLLIGLCIGICTWKWLIVVVVLTIIYLCHSINARRETIDMIIFQTKIKTDKESPREDSNANKQ